MKENMCLGVLISFENVHTFLFIILDIWWWNL